MSKKINHTQIFDKYIDKFIGMTIEKGYIEPDREALAEHRKRSKIFEDRR